MTKHEQWHRGSKSFCEVNRLTDGRYQELMWEEAEKDMQLPEKIFKRMHNQFLKLESQNPQWDWYYIRYDQEGIVAENSDNAPWRYDGEEWVK